MTADLQSTIPTFLPRAHGFPYQNPLAPLLPFLPLFSSPTSLLPSLPSHHLRTHQCSLREHHQQLRLHQNLATVFHWNSILQAGIDSGLFRSALSLFSSMLAVGGVRPDHFTLPLVARAVSALPGRSGLSQSIHSLGIQLGFYSDAYFRNTLIDLYVGCTEIASARSLFDEIPHRDVVTWTIMISGYIHDGDISESFRLFHKMRISRVEPNSVTLAVILRAVEAGNTADGGRQLHGFAIKGGLWSHDLVQNSVLTAYSKVGCFKDAEKIFDGIDERTVVSWNILMLAYFSAGDLFKVAECFQSVMAELYPSPETLTLVISALAKCRDRCKGQQIHSYVVKSGQVDAILRSSFIDFYAKCADLASSLSLLQEVGMNNSCISCVAMMWAFIQNGRFGQAIDLFRTKQIFGIETTADDLSCLVTACTHLGALLLGKAIHGYLIRKELSAESESKTIETSILNMYSKCGSVVWARRCFNTMAYKDTVAWSSMIEGYAVHGIGLRALELFNQMQEAEITPNSITFLSLLSCCSHSGLVSEGCQVFSLMTSKFRIKPEINHYTCMVDLLSRAGKLAEALNLIHSMDAKPDGRIWGALLASCRVHKNVGIGEYAAQRLFELEPDNIGYHIVLSNIHAGGDCWSEVESIWRSMDEKEFKRRPGWSCIEERGGFSMFVAADCSHRRTEDIYETLRCLGCNAEEIKCL